MHDTIHLSLARWRVDMTIYPDALAESLKARFGAFVCPPGGGVDLAVEVENEVPAAGAGTPSSVLHSALTRNGEDYLLDGPTFYGMIGPSRGLARLRLRSDQPAREIEYFLRITLALFALWHDGLLLHCAALMPTDACTSDESGLAYLFVGQSGSGKSTVVALSQAAGRATALGDDLILVRHEPRGWCAYGTPFWNFDAGGREGEPGPGRVAGIYKLIQDRFVFIEPMGRAAAAAELVANCPIVNAQPALLPVLIDRCRDLAGAAGVRRLHFRKDDAFWDVISLVGRCFL